jgi:hypothetical protein
LFWWCKDTATGFQTKSKGKKNGVVFKNPLIFRRKKYCAGVSKKENPPLGGLGVGRRLLKPLLPVPSQRVITWAAAVAHHSFYFFQHHGKN